MPEKITITPIERKARSAASFLYMPTRSAMASIISNIPWIVRNSSRVRRGMLFIHWGMNPIQLVGFKIEFRPA